MRKVVLLIGVVLMSLAASAQNKDGEYDRRLVHRFGKRVWARYYDLDTQRKEIR